MGCGASKSNQGDVAQSQPDKAREHEDFDVMGGSTNGGGFGTKNNAALRIQSRQRQIEAQKRIQARMNAYRPNTLEASQIMSSSVRGRAITG